MTNLQYIQGGDSFALPVEDTVVGIVAGMILGSGEIANDVPIFAFAETPEGKVKVSGRGTRDLVETRSRPGPGHQARLGEGRRDRGRTQHRRRRDHPRRYRDGCS